MRSVVFLAMFIKLEPGDTVQASNCTNQIIGTPSNAYEVYNKLLK